MFLGDTSDKDKRFTADACARLTTCVVGVLVSALQ